MGNTVSRKPDTYQEGDQKCTPSKKWKKNQKKPAQSQATVTMTYVDESIEVQKPDPLDLTDERTLELIRSTWNDDFDVLYQLGVDIYTEIFRLDPSLKNLFKDLNEYDLEKDPMALKQCSAFSKQALRFIQTISKAVQNTGHLDQMDEYLKDIGRRHVQYKESGFKPEHWQIFETAMANVMESKALANPDLDEKDKRLLVHVYKILSHQIVDKLRVGFRDEEVKGVQ